MSRSTSPCKSRCCGSQTRAPQANWDIAARVERRRRGNVGGDFRRVNILSGCRTCRRSGVLHFIAAIGRIAVFCILDFLAFATRLQFPTQSVSLSSIRWRRGLGRGGATNPARTLGMSGNPSPQPSPRSCLAGRGSRSGRSAFASPRGPETIFPQSVSLSSIRWRRGPGRGGATNPARMLGMSGNPSPQPSPRSCLVGRRSRSRRSVVAGSLPRPWCFPSVRSSRALNQ